MQPEKVAETRAWFRRMEDDLRAAEVDLAADPPLVADALFHCQQAVEKALKGFLTWHDRPFRKVHDLREIGAEAIAVDASLEPVIRRSVPLSPPPQCSAIPILSPNRARKRPARPSRWPTRSAKPYSPGCPKRSRRGPECYP